MYFPIIDCIIYLLYRKRGGLHIHTFILTPKNVYNANAEVTTTDYHYFVNEHTEHIHDKISTLWKLTAFKPLVRTEPNKGFN